MNMNMNMNMGGVCDIMHNLKCSILCHCQNMKDTSTVSIDGSS